MRRTARLLGISLTAALMIGGVAGADQKNMDDPNDAEGAMDIQSISHGHKRRQLDEVGRYQHLLVHRFETFDAWEDIEVNRSIISFSFGEKREWGRSLRIRMDRSGALYGEMLAGHDRLVGYARVTRPDDRSLRVIFPRSLLQKGATAYRWSVNIQPKLKSHPECVHDPNSDVVSNDCLDTAAFLVHELS
jgi:hypothetical protein